MPELQWTAIQVFLSLAGNLPSCTSSRWVSFAYLRISFPITAFGTLPLMFLTRTVPPTLRFNAYFPRVLSRLLVRLVIIYHRSFYRFVRAVTTLGRLLGLISFFCNRLACCFSCYRVRLCLW